MNKPLVPEDLRRDPSISAVATLGWRARYLAIARKSNASEARDFIAAHVPSVVQRAAIGASDSSMAPPQISIGQWSDSSKTVSAFYRILSDGAFVRLPWRALVGMITSTASGAVVAEGKAVPVSKVVLGNVTLAPTKVAALCVVTDSLLLATDSAGQQLFNRELLGVISAAVDTAFVDKIDTGLTPITSTGTMADLRAALLAVTSAGLPRLYWIASTDVGKLASTLSAAKGGSATAAVSAVGGQLCNLPLLVSSGVPSGTLYLVDAAQIAANAEAPTIEVSLQASVQMDTAPPMASDVPTAAQMVSMFQTNSVALQSIALFACEKLRNTAVAVVTGISTTTWAAT